MKKEHINISRDSASMGSPLVPDVAQALCSIFWIKGMNAAFVPPYFPISQAPAWQGQSYPPPRFL